MKTFKKPKEHGTESDGFKRHGRPFTLRLLPEEETALREKMQAVHVPYKHGRRWNSFGAFIVWAALEYDPKAKKVEKADPFAAPAKKKRAA